MMKVEQESSNGFEGAYGARLEGGKDFPTPTNSRDTPISPALSVTLVFKNLPFTTIFPQLHYHDHFQPIGPPHNE